MSRRDTIIVAVLINAGLLIVLFASALKSHSSHEDFVANPVPIFQETPDFAFKKGASRVAGDEVDAALHQFTQHSALVAAQATQLPTPVQNLPHTLTPLPVLAPSSFADDLKSIAIPEAPVAAQVQTTPTAQTLLAPIAPQNRPAPEFSEIKVKKGDVLEKIARHHHTTVAEIMKANKLTGSNLRIGQVLKIPNKGIKKTEPSTIVYSPPSAIPGAASESSAAKYYIVKKGDNPWTIAVKNHLKVEDLLKLNTMNEEQARRLKPGDKLRIQ
jgi:peptidoglycan DL-endopeptidase LytF